MTVTIENEFDPKETDEILSFDYRKTAADVLGGFLDVTECPFESEVNVLLTGEEEIREINREQRGIDSVTDVLSFPLHEYETPAGFDELDDDSFDDFDPAENPGAGCCIRAQHKTRICISHSTQSSAPCGFRPYVAGR